MKVKFIESPNCPIYSFSEESINIEYKGKNESIDLSEFPDGGEFESVTTETVEISGHRCIHNVERRQGELYVTLFQEIPVSKISYFKDGKLLTTSSPNEEAPEHDKKVTHRGGKWQVSDWIDSDDYKKGELYIKEVSDEN